MFKEHIPGPAHETESPDAITTLSELQGAVKSMETFNQNPEIIEGVKNISTTTESIITTVNELPEGPAKEKAKNSMLNATNILAGIAGLAVAGYSAYQIVKGEHSALDQENLGHVSAVFVGIVGALVGPIRSYLKKEFEKENQRFGVSA